MQFLKLRCGCAVRTQAGAGEKFTGWISSLTGEANDDVHKLQLFVARRGCYHLLAAPPPPSRDTGFDKQIGFG
ncbi:hypothetical protein M514_03602 [Trichuris suis]|uniref:Uncharacterized protein n=1 Tax=Trichuris suis TaxID=68888 RepID=A0A085MEA4_9BILA|nr:hypothetical protein M513_03602 [Trichuris suis]KFD62978.1 hypothetical protein M514_03602 [Trichuris suis]